MKVKNASSNTVLKNNIVKHILLEAPTAAELEKKIKKYETVLARALTNLYRISQLSLSRDSFYHMTPNGSYQAVISFHFFGINRKHIPFPQQTVRDLEQLTILESGKTHESAIVVSAHLLPAKDAKTAELKFEIDSLDKLEEAICSRQRQTMEDLISKTNLEKISFSFPSKQIDPKTGKVSISMQYQYQTRCLNKSLTGNSGHGEPEEK